MDDHYVYVFVRQDLPVAAQLVHASHAVFHMASLTRQVDGMPNVVVIGIPHLASMKRVIAKLTGGRVPHYQWVDPDCQLGVTAIATVPLSPEQKLLLSNYRLYSPGAEKSACLVAEDGGAKADVAQLREHSVSNGERVGGNPTVGSTSHGTV